MAIIKRTNSRYWRIVIYRNGKHHPFSSGTEDELEARRMEIEILAALRAKREENRLEKFLTKVSGREIKKPGLPLDVAWKTYLVQPGQGKRSARTLNSKRIIWENFTTWLGEQYPELNNVGDISRDIAVAYMGELEKKKVAGQTYNNYKNCLHSVCKVLAYPASLSENPFSVVLSADAIHDSWRPFTRDEIKEICNAATPEWRLAVLVGAYTGLRFADVAHLRWEDVQWAKKLIDVEPRKTARFKKRVSVPLHKALIKEFTAIRRKEGYVMEKLAEGYNDRKQQGEFGKMLDKLKIKGKVCFHSLRHTLVSLIQEAGGAREVARDLVGHGNVEMTKIYSHGLGQMRTAIDAIAEIL